MVETWYNLKFLELSVFVFFRRVFTHTQKVEEDDINVQETISGSKKSSPSSGARKRSKSSLDKKGIKNSSGNNDKDMDMDMVKVRSQRER